MVALELSPALSSSGNARTMELPTSRKRKRKRKAESSPNDDEVPELTTVRSLDDFPDYLLVDIVSCLPTIDAVKASLISRRWRNLWSSIPSLNFSYDDFPPSDSPTDTRRRFVAAVGEALFLRHPHTPLHTFRLLFDFQEDEHYSVITSWVLHAINHYQVTELDVDFFPFRESRVDYLIGTEDPMFDFPFSALHNSEVRVLKISRCYLEWSRKISRLKFDSIRSISLDQSYLQDSMVKVLLKNCSNLESLSLRYVWGMKNCKIFGSKITTLSLKNFNGGTYRGSQSVEIDCPNLSSLEIDSYEVKKYSLNNSWTLVEATVWFEHQLNCIGHWSKVVRLLGHVEKLTVQNWWYTLLEQNEFFSASFKLQNLKWLELKSEYTQSELLGIEVVLELSPNLETWIIDFLDKRYDDEDESLSDELLHKPINLSLPKLRQAKIKCFTETEKEYLFLDLLKRDGVVCQKIVVVHVVCAKEIYPPEVWVRHPNGAKVQGSSPHWVQLSVDGTFPGNKDVANSEDCHLAAASASLDQLINNVGTSVLPQAQNSAAGHSRYSLRRAGVYRPKHASSRISTRVLKKENFINSAAENADGSSPMTKNVPTVENSTSKLPPQGQSLEESNPDPSMDYLNSTIAILGPTVTAPAACIPNPSMDYLNSTIAILEPTVTAPAACIPNPPMDYLNSTIAILEPTVTAPAACIVYTSNPKRLKEAEMEPPTYTEKKLEENAESPSRNNGHLPQSVSFNLSEMVCLMDDDSSSPSEVDYPGNDHPLVTVEGYRVEAKWAPTLRLVLSKHGDIAANSSMESLQSRSFFLELICKVIKKLENSEFAEVTIGELKRIRTDVKDAENARIDVGWLGKRLDDILEAKQEMKKSSTLKEEWDKRKKDTEEVKKELEAFREKVRLTERILATKEAEATNISERISKVKEQVKWFYQRSLVEGLL